MQQKPNQKLTFMILAAALFACFSSITPQHAWAQGVGYDKADFEANENTRKGRKDEAITGAEKVLNSSGTKSATDNPTQEDGGAGGQLAGVVDGSSTTADLGIVVPYAMQAPYGTYPRNSKSGLVSLAQGVYAAVPPTLQHEKANPYMACAIDVDMRAPPPMAQTYSMRADAVHSNGFTPVSFQILGAERAGHARLRQLVQFSPSGAVNAITNAVGASGVSISNAMAGVTSSFQSMLGGGAAGNMLNQICQMNTAGAACAAVQQVGAAASQGMNNLGQMASRLYGQGAVGNPSQKAQDPKQSPDSITPTPPAQNNTNCDQNSVLIGKCGGG